MKRHLLAILAILLGASTLNAYSILPKKPQIQAEPIPGILFPHGQTLDNPAYLIGVSYLGGAAGQLERRVATSGVLPVRSLSKVPSGKIITAPSSWTNGFQIDICGSTAGVGSNSFGFNYSLLSSNSSSNTTSSPTSNPNILPSFALNNSTGATSIVASVTSNYNMPSLQDAIFTYSRSSIVNNFISVMVLTGLHGFCLNHKLNASYEDASANTTSFSMQEVTFGAGPLVGFSSTKRILESFALRGTFFASAPLSNHSLTQSDLYVSGDVPSYGYNTKSVNQLRGHIVAHLDLEAIWRAEFLGGSCLEFILAWHVKQYINQSYLTAMSNNQNAPPSTVQVNVLKAGFSFIF